MNIEQYEDHYKKLISELENEIDFCGTRWSYDEKSGIGSAFLSFLDFPYGKEMRFDFSKLKNILMKYNFIITNVEPNEDIAGFKIYLLHIDLSSYNDKWKETCEKEFNKLIDMIN